MDKIWKIGTSAIFYINVYFLEWKKQNIKTFKIGKKDSKNCITIIYDNDENNSQNIQKTKCTQMIRVLLGYGLIKGHKKFKNIEELIKYNTYYEISELQIEDIYKFIVNHICERIDKVFQYNDSLFPMEREMLFSTLSVGFCKKEMMLEKLINQRLIKAKIADANIYFEEIVLEISKNCKDSYDQMLDMAHEHIIGFKQELTSILRKVDNSTSKETKDWYEELKLDDENKGEIFANPTTFGVFLKTNFSLKNEVNIPVYQRKYIWKERLVKNLLLDIYQTKTIHYIGNITIQSKQSKNKNIIKIIDGQQRITTLILILRALFDFSKYKNLPVDALSNSLFDLKSNESLMNTFNRIKGNSDYNVFKDVVSGNIPNEKSFIVDNYKYILNWISIHLSSKEKLEEFWLNVLNKISMVEIDIKRANEYNLFEKLNTGATPLNTLELFKNYIFNKANELENINEQKAQEMFENYIDSKFSSKNLNKQIEDFIKFYLRVHNHSISDDSYFSQYKELIEREYITNIEEDFNLEKTLKDIGLEIDIYQEISSYEKYSDKNSWVYPFADFLYMLDGRKVYYPLIVQIFYKKIKDFKDTINRKNKIAKNVITEIRGFLRIIEIFEVRFQIASYRGQSLSSKIESILQKLNKKDMTLNDFWHVFNDSDGSTGMASIDSFEEKIKKFSVDNKPAKLIMTRIENYYYLNGWNLPQEDYTFRAFYDKKSEREHLLPKEWKTHWMTHLKETTNYVDEELETQVDKYKDFIGNAFPIPTWANQSVKNNSLKHKIKAFLGSPHSKDTAMFNGFTIEGIEVDRIDEKFTIETIKDRSEKIAKIARIIWQDFN